jgi:hypothetical protein
MPEDYLGFKLQQNSIESDAYKAAAVRQRKEAQP